MKRKSKMHNEKEYDLNNVYQDDDRQVDLHEDGDEAWKDDWQSHATGWVRLNPAHCGQGFVAKNRLPAASMSFWRAPEQVG